MRWTLVSTLPWIALFAACGGSTPKAESPENSDKNPSSESGGDGKASEASNKDPDLASPGADKDSAGGKPAPCGGSDISNLAAVLAQGSCEAKGANPETSPKDLTDRLEIKASIDARHVAPGGKATVGIAYHNKTGKDLPLYFVVDPEPRFEFQVFTPKGARVDRPAGLEPPLPPEVANAPAPEKVYALVTIAPQGTARVSLPWDAVKYKWASKEAAKGAVPGRGFPRAVAGPLPRGKYVLRIVTPLVGVTEGIDHEVTQPRLDLEVKP
jgi:hypothetical protein